MGEKATLSPPWVTFYRELETLFENDPDVLVQYGATHGGDGDAVEEPEVTVYVEGSDKADALAQLLPAERTFGDVTLRVTVVPANDKEETRAELFARAFAGNPALSYVAELDGVMTNPMYFVVFRNQVVQYWNDNLGDINGNVSTLYQEIAKDVFDGEQGVFFCTDGPENLGVPQGE